MSDIGALYLPGRFQPPTNHHFRLLRHISETYEPDTLSLGLLPPRERTGSNPFTVDEVATMVDDGVADLDLDVPVDTFVLDEHPLHHRKRVVERLGEPATFFTRERRWVAVSRMLAAADRFNGGPHDIGMVYEPRDNTVLEPYGDEPYLDSATEVRERMAGGQRWERYVPDTVADRIVDDYADGLDVCRDRAQWSTGKYDVLHRGWAYLGDVLSGDGADPDR